MNSRKQLEEVDSTRRENILMWPVLILMSALDYHVGVRITLCWYSLLFFDLTFEAAGKFSWLKWQNQAGLHSIRRAQHDKTYNIRRITENGEVEKHLFLPSDNPHPRSKPIYFGGKVPVENQGQQFFHSVRSAFLTLTTRVFWHGYSLQCTERTTKRCSLIACVLGELGWGLLIVIVQ